MKHFDHLKPLSERIAHHLLEIGAISISPEEPYVWSSGMMAPIYCDNRLTLSYPELRAILIDGLIEKAADYEFDYIAGVATAGIAHAAMVAQCLSLPLIYVRPEPKGHGQGNQIEGYLPAESKVLMVEDLVATGLSSIQAAEAVKKVTGAMPVGCLAIFTYNLLGVKDLFATKGSPLETLSDFDALLRAAIETQYIDSHQRDSLLEWRNDYQSWTVQHQ